MENNARTEQDSRKPLRDWIDPTRIYNIRIPAGRMDFFWGLVVYPLVVMLVLMTPVIIIMESTYSGMDLTNNLGIAIWCLMLVWVTAAVCACYRRLRDLGRSPAWIWLIVLPVVNFIFLGYLLIKAAPRTGT